MDDQPRPALVAAHVDAIDARTKFQTDRLTGALMRGAWPGGHADSSNPAAAEWLRRWGPARTLRSYMDDCSCVQGRCAVCN